MAPHDIPRSHSYIRHKEVTALCFTIEATLLFCISELNYSTTLQHVCHSDNSSVHLHFSQTKKKITGWGYFSSASAEDCNSAGRYSILRTELEAWHTYWRSCSQEVNLFVLFSREGEMFAYWHSNKGMLCTLSKIVFGGVHKYCKFYFKLIHVF